MARRSEHPPGTRGQAAADAPRRRRRPARPDGDRQRARRRHHRPAGVPGRAPALFGFLVEARTRLALYAHRAAHGDERIRLRLWLWLRHPVRAARAWLWLARQSAPAYDRAAAEHDQLRATRHAITLALPGHTRPARRARAIVLRELNAGRLTTAAAVETSGLLTRPNIPALHRAALAASLGAALPAPGGQADTAPPGQPDTTPDRTADASPEAEADGPPDNSPDTAKRTPRGSGKGGTAAAAARLHDRHPAMTAASIGKRLGVSERTVRRHLANRSDPPPPAPPGALPAGQTDGPAGTPRTRERPEGHPR
ncbi:MAG: hypothetical protein ACR2MP_18415 [Streptosporangiaceae bacterium]